ncbi:unnamed protein product [Symbiodinium pilosum]|uniref:Uncharacterized protein n=1 Tax=Symbiodinium pilosum TaxID=2952 RepID=A0A812W5U8_SYMPI|nr:unnamed protein product [Symbiodinium pilosum]
MRRSRAALLACGCILIVRLAFKLSAFRMYARAPSTAFVPRLSDAVACSRAHRHLPARVLMRAGKKEWFGINDVRVITRNPEDVAAFHDKERTRWREVYNEDYVESPQDFYPGDRIEVIDDESDYEGRQGVVLNYDFDDGYMSCQTTNSRYPLTVMLDEV